MAQQNTEPESASSSARISCDEFSHTVHMSDKASHYELSTFAIDPVGLGVPAMRSEGTMVSRSIRSEEGSIYPTGSRDESTDSLLKADEADHHNQKNSKSLVAHKSTFLHPSMWLWEVLSLSLAAFILVGVIALLATYNGKPSPVVGGITLNTVVAFASTLFRICLMVPVTACIGQLAWVWLHKGYQPLQDIVKFDLASREPLGSLQLVWDVKFRYVRLSTNFVVSPHSR
jgi:hypothetical protein